MIRKSPVLLCIIFLVVSIVFAFKGCLSFYVTGDAVTWLYNFRFHPSHLFVHPTNAFHYHPLALIWYGMPVSAFGFEPFWIHLNSLLLHLANSVLVFILTLLLLRRTSCALAAALLFSTGIYVPETVCWGGGFPNASMTFLFLVCFFLYRYYFLKRSVSALVAFNAMFALSLFVFPTTMNFIFVFFLYAALDPEGICEDGVYRLGKRTLLRAFKLSIPQVLSILFFLVIRSFFVNRMTYNSLNPLAIETYQQVLWRMFQGADLLLVPSQFIRAFLPRSFHIVRGTYVFLSLIFMSVLFAVTIIRALRKELFVVSWFLIHMSLVALETDMGSRHLYSISISASLLFVIFLFKMVDYMMSAGEKVFRAFVHSRGYLSPQTGRGVALVIAFAVLFVPIKNNLANVRYFMDGQARASDIVRQSVDYVKSVSPKPPDEGRIVLVNLPYALCPPGGLSAFVLPGASLLYLLDLESGNEMWSRKYATGVCAELYVPPQSTWEFFNELNRPRRNQDIRRYTPEELKEFVMNGDMILLFDYEKMRPSLLTKELAAGLPGLQAK